MEIKKRFKGDKLTILIATIEDRKLLFDELVASLCKQVYYNNLENEIQIISALDNKEVSIGSKRQLLLTSAKAKFITYLDDDDMPSENYCKNIVNAIIQNPNIDCIGMNVNMTTNGQKPQRCCHRLAYKEWKDNVDGWDYVRNITHFNPVLREKALQVGFKDIRYGEDKDYSDRLTPLLTKEFYIEEPLFHYRYTTQIPHKQKYGIR